MLSIPKALIELFNEPPLPPLSDADANRDYWSQDAIDARVRRRRLRMLVGWSAFASVVVLIAFLAFVVRVDPTALMVGLHVPFVAAAVVLLAVPSWRRWLFTTQAWWPNPLFFFAYWGALWIAAFWPNALGGTSVGFPLLFGLIAGVLVGGVFMLINLWRSDRRTAIELLAMVAIFTASLFVAEHFFGKTYGWLVAMVPLLAYVGISALYTRRRERRGEAGAK